MERPSNHKSITTLDISYKNLTELPFWINECKNLEILDCSYNNITQLDNLQIRLKILTCSDNKITQLNNLPSTLKELNCYNNPLKYDFKPTIENIRNYNIQNQNNQIKNT